MITEAKIQNQLSAKVKKNATARDVSEVPEFPRLSWPTVAAAINMAIGAASTGTIASSI